LQEGVTTPLNCQDWAVADTQLVCIVLQKRRSRSNSVCSASPPKQARTVRGGESVWAGRKGLLLLQLSLGLRRGNC